MANPTNSMTDPGTGKEIPIPGNWQGSNGPVTAGQPSFTIPAAGAGIRLVLNAIIASIACNATAQTPITVVVRDGASGVGPIIWHYNLSAPVGQGNGCYPSEVTVLGSPNTPMTVEFNAACAAGVVAGVAGSGYCAIKTP